jgi:phospholipid transport system transporter-binding protein
MTARVVLPAVLTQTEAQSVVDDLVGSLRKQLPQGGEAVLDASALTHFDSTALAVLLACRRAVLALGGQLRVIGLPPRAQALAQVYGVGNLWA